MAWMWLISVGVTDVQFPVWQQDRLGRWDGPLRFEIGRAGIRAVHEGLLALQRNGQVRFPSECPKTIGRELARELRLEFLQENEDFLATIRPAEYRISGRADTIPNEQERQIPLYIPKIQPLLGAARALFGDAPRTIVVLNTRRNAELPDGPNEPVASGPLVAKFLAQQLGLEWIDSAGLIPAKLASNTSTWVDILTNDEAMEDAAAQQQVVRRLFSVIRAWNPGQKADVVLTLSGGMGPLKPLFERVPATCVGQRNVKLLEEPERGRGPAISIALDYDARVVEQETLRFHCAEALRSGDYAGAYGLATRFPNQPWATLVRNRLGPLLDLPYNGTPWMVNGRHLHPHELSACQIESRLCAHDVGGAVIRLGAFLESVRACLNGDAGRALSQAARKGIQAALARLKAQYNKPQERLRNRPGPSIRDHRNDRAHETGNAVNLGEVEADLRRAGLIAGTGLAFGKNFLEQADVAAIFNGFGVPDLSKTLGATLDRLLDEVIGGQ